MEKGDRIREILIDQGSIGRENGKKISRYMDLTADDGVTRPAGTDLDRKTRDYFTELCRKNGLDPFVDVFGNIFVTLQGTDPGIIMMGSHLDSVVHGGMFDGAMGVFSSLEVLLRLRESGYKNKKTLVVAAFTGEEGSAFHQPMLGSNGFPGNSESPRYSILCIADLKSIPSLFFIAHSFSLGIFPVKPLLPSIGW